MTGKRYTPYKATKWEGRIDGIVGLASPRMAYRRMMFREQQHRFRYLNAQSNLARQNANPTTSGEIARGSREKMQIMWNAIDMVENSGLASGILQKFQTYVCGSLRWQPRTSDKGVNDEHAAFFKERFGKPSLDVTGRFNGRQLAGLLVKGGCLKGDMGINIARMGGQIALQGIEANRIGDPYSYKINNNYIRGLILDDVGRIAGARIYNQDRMSGRYYYSGDTIPARDKNGLPRFLFFVNPISYDDYRGVSIFKTAIDNGTYIEAMRKYELQALLWAASQSGVYFTNTGNLPEDLPFDKGTPVTDSSGNIIDTYQVRPNTITSLSSQGGERVEMFQHDRPSPNVMNMYRNVIMDISVGTGLTFAFCYDMTGFTGPAIRQMSGQDARAIGMWQSLLEESFLSPAGALLLSEGIANKEIQYHPDYLKGKWFFPPRITIDVGRETAAGISEVGAMLNSGADYAAENSQDISEIATQRGHETQEAIEIAMAIADKLDLPWDQVYSLMKPGPRQTASPLADAAKAQLPDSMDDPGATNDGASFDEGGNGNGKTPAKATPRAKKLRAIIRDVIELYREDQARDKGGKFEDEGRGSEEEGYVHPGSNGDEGKKKDVGEPTFPARPSSRDDDVEAIMGMYDDQPRYQIQGKSGTEFFSPTTEPMNFDEAVKAVNSSKQVDAHLVSGHIDNALNLNSTAHDGIGEWKDGAENSVIHEITGLKDFDELRYAAALKGRALNQKAVLAFEAGDGNDAIHKTTVPTDNLQEIRGKLDKAGIVQRTLLPDGKNTAIMVFDQGNKLGSNIADVAKQYGTKAQTIRGTGEFVGESDTREGAVKNYTGIIKDYEQKFPDRGHYKPVQGKGVHHNGSQITSAAKVNPPNSDADLPRYSADLKSTPDYLEVNEKLDNLAKEVKNKDKRGGITNWSIDKNSDSNGKLTPEREALHKKLIDESLNPKAVVKEGERPKLNLLIGAPGSGKTSAGRPLIKGETTYIAPDDLRERLPEYLPWNTPATQNESRTLTEKLFKAAVGASHNLTVDITGSNKPLTNEFVNEAGKKGYDVNVLHVQIPLHEAAKRAFERWYQEGKKQGRFTDPEYISGHVDHLPESTYDELKSNQYVKSWTRVDNSGKTPKIVDQGSKA